MNQFNAGKAVPRLIAVIALLALIWATLWLLRPSPPEPVAPPVTVEGRIDGERLFADLAWLAAPEREGRGAGTAGGLASREWIVERFDEIGLATFLHHFDFDSREGNRITGAANIIGRLDGLVSRGPVIAITAHYDGLGIRDGEIYHGADDNASGVAALLELARYFSQPGNQLSHNLLFIAFDAEEHGKVGAYRMFEDHVLEEIGVDFNLNMDMISRDLGNNLFAVGTTHYPWLRDLVIRLGDVAQVNLVIDPAKDEEWTNASDHAAFHDQGIPFIYFGVDDHPDYHRPTDTSDRVDRDFHRRAVETILDFILFYDDYKLGDSE